MPRPPWRFSLLGAGTALAVMLALTSLLVAAEAIRRFFSPVPVADIWWMFKEYRDAGVPPPVSSFWTALIYTPHRIPLPKLFYLADWSLAGGTGMLSVAAALAFQATHVVAAWVWLRRQAVDSDGKLLANLAGAVLLFALFAIQQWENLLHGFQLCFTLWLLLGFLSLAATVNGRPVAAHASAIGSMLCVVGGVVAWPVMLVIAWRKRQSSAALASFAAVPIVFSALYVYRLEYVQRVPPGAMIAFFMKFFAQPFLSRESALMIWLGPLLCAAGLLVAWRLFTAADAPNQMPRLLIAANLTFLLLAIAVMSFGRGDWGYATRYHTVALLFWAWTSIGLLYWNVRRFLAPILVFMALAIAQFPAAWRTIESEYRALSIDGTAMAVKMPGSQEFIPGLSVWLAGERKSLWHAEPFSRIGTQWSATRECATERITNFHEVKHGWKIAGAGATDSGFAVLIRDSDRKVVGVAAKAARFDGATLWTGHLPSAMSGASIRLGLREGGGCWSTRSTVLPAMAETGHR